MARKIGQKKIAPGYGNEKVYLRLCFSCGPDIGKNASKRIAAFKPKRISVNGLKRRHFDSMYTKTPDNVSCKLVYSALLLV